MREICASGSVGGEGGNLLAYPAIRCRHWGRPTTAEDDPNVWSGRASQEVFIDPSALRSCINVSGL